MKSITGTFNHPGCRSSTNPRWYPQAVAPWVGIDAQSRRSSLIQAGTNCIVEDGSGRNTHTVWIYSGRLPLPSGCQTSLSLWGNIIKADITAITTRSATM
ncbi:hypothetical protein B0T14DRAFT_194038 [Immersiella caudata]|uniref:Uncharacterized protein n=1 Tax=Immersiella caudata TaxID=314043 RepID=A0AA39WZR3_9PEZI|nr:hypothetical protein B0T14DRAFT_194038 [Immersiella caudata]